MIMRKTVLAVLFISLVYAGCDQGNIDSAKQAENPSKDIKPEETVFKVTTSRQTAQGYSVKNVIAYYEPGRFCGWPANGGSWSWGDEILVGFALNYYQEKENRHSFNRDMPRETVFARSMDGGETWKLERHPVLSDSSNVTQCPGGIDFSNPDLAIKLRGELFNVSNDRGRTWSGTYRLPKFGQIKLMARTDYIVNGKDECMIFLTATKTNGKEGRPFCAKTTDGGKTFEFLSWISDEPEGFSIMPSTVRISGDELITAIRRQEKGNGFIEIYRSQDNGQSWSLLSTPAGTGRHNGNPASMIKLAEGRIALTYGFRSEPSGIMAKLSNDNGRTWSKKIDLRLGARTWDIGYPQSIQRTDGKIVTLYYFATADKPEQHIPATIWNPNIEK
jgi:Neuraminidase (sialidase)